MRKKRVLARNEFSLDEEIAECLVRVVSVGTSEHDFGVTGQLDLARARSVVGQRNAPHLGVVFG